MKLKRCFGKKLLVLFSSFVILLISTGMTMSFGVLYSTILGAFGADKGKTALIPSIHVGVLTLTGLISGTIVTKVGHRKTIICGSFLMAVGMTCSAFIDNMYMLYVTYGVIAGCGASLLHIDGNVMIVEHFTKWKSVAFGFASMGGGVGSVALPYLTNLLIDIYGWRGAFILVGGLFLQGLIIGTATGLWSNKRSAIEIGNEQAAETDPNSSRKGFTTVIRAYLAFVNKRLGIFALSCFFLVTAYVVPFNMVPDKLVSRGFALSSGAWVASGMGFGNMLGRVIFGLIADLTDIQTIYIYMFGLILSGAMTLAMVYAEHFYQYIIIGIFLGIGTGNTAALIGIIPAELTQKENIAKAYGLAVTCGGFGAIVGSPIAGMPLSFGVLYSTLLRSFRADQGKTALIPSIHVGVVALTGSVLRYVMTIPDMMLN